MALSIGRSSFSSVASQGSVQSSSQPELHDDVDSGRPFLEMMRAHALYKTMLNVKVDYDVRLVHGLGHLHWYLLVRMKSSSSPYITLEITTSDMMDIIPTTRSIVPNGGFWAKLLSLDPTDVGTYNGSLCEMCIMADEVIAEMERYHFVENNCQHFCNKVLKKMNFKTYPTTVGPALGGDDQRFDFLTIITRNLYDAAIGDEATVAETAMITGAVGAPPALKGDLNFAYSTLLPLADRWEEIGDRILIDQGTLSNIRDKYKRPRRCLTEMLRVWIQRCPNPPWKVLGDVVVVYDPTIASKLRSKAI